MKKLSVHCLNRLKVVVLLACVIGLFCFSCSKKSAKGEEPLARVGDKYLYPSDVKNIFYSTSGGTDSLRVLQVFVNNWIKNQLFAQVAEKNLNEEEKNVQQELDEYRNSLLIHKYQSRLIMERLDTVTTEEQLREYYNNNKNSFELARNIVQLNFVKIDKSKKVKNDITRLFLSSSIKDRKLLAALCEKHAANYFLDDETWLDFSEVQKELPIKQYDEEHFLRNNKFLEINEGKFLYLILIKAYRTKNSLSSFEFEKERIRTVLLNQRKIDLLKKAETDMQQKATENKVIENYTRK